MSREAHVLEDAAVDAAKPSKNLVLSIGDVVDGRYEVTAALGSGGMGEVYEVLHLALRKTFALKCLKEDALGDARSVQRFLKEIRGLASVHSEFVVPISDCGKLENGSPYLVMERLRGRDLRKLLADSQPLPIVRALKLIIDGCLGLQAVHDAGLVHRDLKPENLFVTRTASGNERCMVLDFGIAKVVGTGSTKQHSLIGTLKYMAPEQIADPASVGPECDIYSMGAILYEALAGRPPHAAETEPELMFKVMNQDPSPLATLVPEIDEALSSVVKQCLSRAPARRSPSAVALAGALAACLVTYGDNADSSDNTTRRDRMVSKPTPLSVHRRRLGLAVAAGLVVGALLAFVALSSRNQAKPAAAPDQVQGRQEQPHPSQPAPATLTALAPAVVTTNEPSAPASARSVKEPPRAVREPSSPKHRPTLPSFENKNPYE